MAEARYWDAFYRRGKIPWRSSGVGKIARQFLSGATRGGRLLEIGCGIGDDARDLIELGFDYSGIDFSSSAIARATQRLEGLKVNLICADFLLWKPKKRYAIVYEKGAFHRVKGLRNRQIFAHRVGSALDKQGIWITVSMAAFLTHLIESCEPYFEILKIAKGPYGTRNPANDFEAWYVMFRRRD